ncbi:HNH endonuclease [Paenibacillus piscarius]|uniref:HNH endonuclease n=1 Tax=Paenibacillus piscarius TaxID=1089681 RepID=UPI001EE78996|nr:HNH endonuclease signature motif containing protein [Paenibacillus piscarius]
MEIENGLDDLSRTEKLTMIKLRVAQSIFKDRLLQQRQKCDLCGLTNVRLLRASHIKQWSSCKDSNERLDPENGLLLCPNHDQIFDRKLISFDDVGNILISPMLTDLDRNFLNIDEFRRLNLSEKKSRFMQWHRQVFLSKHESE